MTMGNRELAIEAIDGVGLAEFHIRAVHDTCEALGERQNDSNEHIWRMLQTEAGAALDELEKSKTGLERLLEKAQ